ncbi:phosphomannomutase [Halorientalis sp. IM1011]|uniref:phosphomannomutase n=1 Tax=Halorientalis sp. IM1011 TaxID=1932360 RepID=UPI00097CC144|nr:phosphomannomutase [Halorientalis sp. IM1011]AQL41330.1 phosphomannomutase [Halorientalis sp. IM1011]
MKLFGTAGIRGPVDGRVTPELALAVGRAAAADGDEFVLGRDGRETSPALAAAVAAGLESGGATVCRIGEVPTPALAYASRGRRGLMITASHNPPTDNGLKLFVDGQEYGDDAEARIEARVEEGCDPAAWDAWGEATELDVLERYRAAVVDYAAGFGASPDGLTVAVDCGNGMGSVATPQVLRALGADVRALNATVDGHFPGRESKPTPESLADLRAFVADGDADLGIGHDGDADRIVLVDEDGEIVHEDTVLAVLAERYVRESAAGDPVVVTTPNASARIDERVEAAGGRVERTALGVLHEGLAAARADGDRETEVVFAAEPWKHMHTGFGDWIDGVVSAAVLTRLVAASGLSRLTEPVTERPYRKANVRCPDEQKAATMQRVEERLPELFPEATVETEYGVRMAFPDASWVLVRPSGTEPYVRVYAESDEVDELIAETVEAVECAVD